MKISELSIPEIGLIAGTRGLLGAGIGLLLADKLGRDRRSAVGWTLLAVGALTTIPLVLEAIGKSSDTCAGRTPQGFRDTETAQPFDDSMARIPVEA